MTVRRFPLIAILLLSVTLVLSGCTSAETNDLSDPDNLTQWGFSELDINSTDKKITIGLALGTLKEERWANERMFFEEEAKKKGALVITEDANMDEERQKEQIRSLIEKQVDVLVIVAVNEKTAAESVAEAKKAGIPVLAYSRMIQNADLDAFIGFDAVKIGETLAKAATENVPKGNYMIINGAPIDNNAKQQKIGYDNILGTLADRGDISIICEGWCENWSPEKAYELTKAALDDNGSRIDAIIASNDGMAGGAIRALEEYGLEGSVFVTGTDGELAALRRIAKGTQSVTLLFPQKEFAEEGARAAISLANKMIPADATGKTNNGFGDIPTIFARFVLVTRNNIDKVISEQGLYNREEIYQEPGK